MNNLAFISPTMNKDIITQVLQEILQENPNYFLPKQLHVISWKSKTIPDALITKINGQRYLGTLRKDSQGQEYWRYKLLPNPEPSGQENSALPSNSSETIAKFQQRPENSTTEQEKLN